MNTTQPPAKRRRQVAATAIAGLMAISVPLASAPNANALMIGGVYIPDRLVYETFYQPLDYRKLQSEDGTRVANNTVPAGFPADVARTGFGPPGTTYRANPDNEVRLDVGLFTGDVYIPREARNKIGNNRVGVDIRYPDGTEETSWFMVEVPETTASQSVIRVDGYPGQSLVDDRLISRINMRVGHEEVIRITNTNPSKGLEGFFDEGARLMMTDEYGDGEELTEWAQLIEYGDSGDRGYEVRFNPGDSQVGWNRIHLTAQYEDESWRTVTIDVIVAEHHEHTPTRSVPPAEVEAWTSLRVPMDGAPLPEGTLYRGMDTNPRWAKVNRFTGEIHYEPKSAGIQLREYNIGVNAKLPDGTIMPISTTVKVKPYNQGTHGGGNGTLEDLAELAEGLASAPEYPDQEPDFNPGEPSPPEQVDSDGDGVPDEVEEFFGTDPFDPEDKPSEEDFAEYLPEEGDGTVYVGSEDNPEWLLIDPATGDARISDQYTGSTAPEPGQYSYWVVAHQPSDENEPGDPHAVGVTYSGVFTVQPGGVGSGSLDSEASAGEALSGDEARADQTRRISAGDNDSVRVVNQQASTYSLNSGVGSDGEIDDLPDWLELDEDRGVLEYDVPEDVEGDTHVAIVSAHDEAGDVMSESVVVLHTQGAPQPAEEEEQPGMFARAWSTVKGWFGAGD